MDTNHLGDALAGLLLLQGSNDSTVTERIAAGLCPPMTAM